MYGSRQNQRQILNRVIKTALPVPSAEFDVTEARSLVRASANRGHSRYLSLESRIARFYRETLKRNRGRGRRPRTNDYESQKLETFFSFPFSFPYASRELLYVLFTLSSSRLSLVELL